MLGALIAGAKPLWNGLSARQLTGLAGGGSLLVLAAALAFQAAGVAPCPLCITQRWPHLACALIAALALTRGPAKLLSLAGAASALTTGAIGLYHSGVERGVFAGPDSCTSNGTTAVSAQDLLDQIRAAPLIRCDEIAWQMLGVTMPNLNVIASALFVWLWLSAWRRA